MDLYVNRNLVLESTSSLEDACFVLLGVPYDSTESFRPGSRFAPLEVRREFLELEKELGGVSFFDVPFHDLGNVEVVYGNTQKTLRRVEDSVKYVFEKNKDAVLVVLGGEHTVCYPPIKVFSQEGLDHVVQLDAHMDLKREYLGEEWSHATIMRQVSKLGVGLTQVGVRSGSFDERDYAEENGIAQYYNLLGDENFFKEIEGKRVYITLDVDVLDPAVAPGVSNPEPGGLDLNSLSAIINRLVECCSVVGFDVVEVCPLFDTHVTSTTAAKILLNFMVEYYKKTGK